MPEKKKAGPMTSREIVGYILSSSPDFAKELAQSDYTTAILCFIVPGSSGELELSSELSGLLGTKDQYGVVSSLKSAGKRVLVSLGGETFSTQGWADCANNLDQTVNSIKQIVTDNGFDGVDIDWEDTNYTGYDPITFLTDLSSSLKSQLPNNQNFITHAPQCPYFYGGTGYLQVYVDVAQNAGNNIDLYNIQYYNNDWYVGDTAQDETGKVAGTELVSGSTFPSSIVGIVAQGVPVEKLLVGKPTTTDNAGSGYLNTQDIITYLINPLISKYDDDFAGVMGWQYDTQYGASTNTDDWASALASAMSTSTAGSQAAE
ncbi:glycosyl hydrolase family 18 protein [Flexibacterium corallicola]|uniref:glycosyl hydrolase family 18 protein n=1 Tax=Flexibacterium corallicola TaxID=3037259 RepID=UPI00286F62F2|nr:glycosyl hydrolase family 18 protein [Pseudovibrio sp. M1P-2-3]